MVDKKNTKTVPQISLYPLENIDIMINQQTTFVYTLLNERFNIEQFARKPSTPKKIKIKFTFLTKHFIFFKILYLIQIQNQFNKLSTHGLSLFIFDIFL